MTPRRVLQRLEALRHAMKTADGERDGSFGAVFSAFLDAAEDPAFLDASAAATDDALEGTLAATARRATGDASTTVEAVRMMRIAGAGFLHGGFFTCGRMGTFFYFEEEHQGLVAFTAGAPPTQIARITVTELPQGTVPMRRPKGVQ